MLIPARLLLALTTLTAPASFNSMLPGWFTPLPQAAVTSQESTIGSAQGTREKTATPTPPPARRPPTDEPHPLLATTMMARVAWQAGRDEAAEVWSRLTTTSEAVSAAAPTLRLPGPGALSRAWQTLALQSHIPFLLGSMQVTDGVQVLVLSPVGKMSNPEALLPVCVSFEGADKAPHETCALIAESGGRVPLASANNASWVTASIDTPQGPRLAMAPALLAHALHVAPFMPPSARARLAGAIDATTRKGFIEPADCVAALLAIDFASLRRPGESRAATG